MRMGQKDVIHVNEVRPQSKAQLCAILAKLVITNIIIFVFLVGQAVIQLKEVLVAQAVP